MIKDIDEFENDFYDFLTTEVTTTDVVDCVTSLNGWNYAVMYDILYYFTGWRSLEQASEECGAELDDLVEYESELFYRIYQK